MSTINVHDIQGLSTYANNVRLPNGHQLRIDGTIKMPEWTVSTRPASPETGQIGWNGELARFEGYTGNDWVAIGDEKADGSSADKALDKATDVMTNVSNPPTGWYWVKVNGVAKQVWIDTVYDGGGWSLVASHKFNISIQTLNYSQAATSTDWYSNGGVYGSGDPKTYTLWAGLDAWNNIAQQNNVGRNVVYYVAGSSVPLGTTGSHNNRARWTWTGWGTNYDWVGEANLNVQLGSTPGVWSYHISNGYNFTATDRDQDVYGANCANLYNTAPWWYGACWSGSFWGGNGANYQNAAFWNSSGGDYWNYGAYYVK